MYTYLLVAVVVAVVTAGVCKALTKAPKIGLTEARVLMNRIKARYNNPDIADVAAYSAITGAKLAGAEITVNAEAKDAIAKINSAKSAAKEEHEKKAAERKQLIEDLLKQVKEEELNAEDAASLIATRVHAYDNERSDVNDVLTFFAGVN